MSRRLLSSATAVLLLAGVSIAGLEGCRASAQADGAPPPPVVTVASPIVQVEPGWSEHSGRFVAAQTVDVRPRISGYLKAVHFKDGEYVRQGQLLFTLDPLPLQAKADKSAAELLQADARLERARADLRRAEILRAADAISAEELDSRKEAAAQAAAAKTAAEAALRADRLDLGYTQIHAPIAGRISDRRVDAGNLVQNGETVLTQIVSVDPIHFEFAAAEELQAEAGALKQSARQVLVKLEGESDFVHTGRLDFVDNRIDPASGSLRARAVFANPQGQFTAGQFARVRVLTATVQPVVLAPDSAIAADQSRKFVLVVGAGNKVEQRTVQTGAKIGELRIIRQGLTAADRIVINGQQRAMPGMPVTPQAGRIAVAARVQPQG
jgi:RND family efflux transporter MFP subunit